MKFLVDAQLPARLARFLNDAGHDVVHTSELPEGNRTTHVRIAEVADGEGRVVITKDRDFRDGRLLSGPLGLFEANLDAVVDALGEADFVELGPGAMVIHRRRGPR